MSDSPQTPEAPKQRFHREYEDPHYHDEDEVAPVDADEPRVHRTTPPPRPKPAYRPPRRFYEE